jgi:hypothetical protein
VIFMPTGIYIRTEEYKRNFVPWNKGLTKEINSNVKQISEKLTGRLVSKQHKINMRLAHLGKPTWNKGLTKETDERVRLNSEAIKGHTSWSKGKTKDTDERLKQTEERRKHTSLASKENWKNPEIRDKRIRAIFSANHKSPNKKELFLDVIIQETIPNSYCYTGDGKKLVVINGRVPDWTNTNGQKKVINFNGLYWHLWKKQKTDSNLTKEQVENAEKLPYNTFGYGVLFIWEDELNDLNNLKNKLIDFDKKELRI